MTPEEINIKALELAVQHYKGKTFVQQAQAITEIAIEYRDFLADISWADEKKLAVTKDKSTGYFGGNGNCPIPLTEEKVKNYMCPYCFKWIPYRKED